MAIRLTSTVVQQLLSMNEGFVSRTAFSSKNNSWERLYKIVDGAVKIHESGKTSWADSRYANDLVADHQETLRFLRKNLHALKTDGLN